MYIIRRPNPKSVYDLRLIYICELLSSLLPSHLHSLNQTNPTAMLFTLPREGLTLEALFSPLKIVLQPLITGWTALDSYMAT